MKDLSFLIGADIMGPNYFFAPNKSPSISPLRLESEFHSRSYRENILDIWMFTNSSKIKLNYLQTRIGHMFTLKFIIVLNYEVNEYSARWATLLPESEHLNPWQNLYGFKILFKCLSGGTTDDGKFIVALMEKQTFPASTARCES